MMKSVWMRMALLGLWLFALSGVTAAQAQEETPEAAEACVLATNAEATPEATPEATEAVIDEPAEPLLVFTALEPYDLRFNPNAENPFALIMNFTLDFENPSQTRSLELRRPQFALWMEGIEWGELVSTDFQMGEIAASGEFGIALQNLTLLNRISDEQHEIVACIQQGKAIDLRVTGQLEANLNGAYIAIAVDFEHPDALLAAP